ncbi:MAG: hypothetical protein QM698_03915 [Micropepsaceae bacterium]
MSNKLVREYAQSIQAGRWFLNGAPLVIGSDGQLLDGRARLLACIQAEKPFRTLIVEGIDPSAFETIDAVRKRQTADVLAIRQIQHSRAVASALRIILAFQAGSLSKPPSASPVALIELLQSYPEIQDSISPSKRAAPLLPHGVGIALHYLFGLSDPKKADEFFVEIAVAQHKQSEAAPAQLRKALEVLDKNRGYRRQAYVLAISIKAWNAFLSGKTPRQLRFAPKGEAFPEIAGIERNTREKLSASRRVAEVSKSKPYETNLRVKVQEVSPKQAERILKNNTLNRGISGSVVDKYARDMREGRWKLNGQTIKITDKGALVDGQHRLAAVKKAGRPFPAIIVEGVPEETLSSLDFGHKRSMAEILRDRSEVNTAVLASALRWLWMIQHEVVLAARVSPTNGEMLELLEKCPEIRMEQGIISALRPYMGSGIASALYYIFSKQDKDKAQEFFGRLIDGVQLGSDNPVLLLRERLGKDRTSHRIRMAEAERVALTQKAWSAFRSGRSMQRLAWRSKGAGKDEMPMLL